MSPDQSMTQVLYRQGDITTLEVDSIVNAANSSLGGISHSPLLSNNTANVMDQVVQEVNLQVIRARSHTELSS